MPHSKPDKVKVPISVGHLLRLWVFSNKVPYSGLARRAGIDHAHMSRILNDQVGITATTALRLEQATGFTALRLMMTQVKYELAKARQTRAKLAQAGIRQPDNNAETSKE